MKTEKNDDWVRRTTYEKMDGGLCVGIDLNNQKHLCEMGRLVEKKEARPLNRFAYGIIYYFSKQKLS